jgi:2-polyprenyl-3-methyl-5-hydroxy-6-metoxy-1,4-benzoquinol methylase
MDCCQVQGINEMFDDKLVNEELKSYRSSGPRQTTRILIDALKAEGVRGASLLDIGGGVGAIQCELLEAGCQAVTDVDASQAYLRAAREEAQRRGLAERISYQQGNFIDLAEQIPAADIVTLDRVICCYPDMEKLVGLSVARARKLYGLVFPRDTWWARMGIVLMNFIFRLQGSSFRTFTHPTRVVEDLIQSSGLKRQFYRRTAIWQVMVYAR